MAATTQVGNDVDNLSDICLSVFGLLRMTLLPDELRGTPRTFLHTAHSIYCTHSLELKTQFHGNSENATFDKQKHLWMNLRSDNAGTNP